MTEKKLLIEYSAHGIRTALTEGNLLREVFLDENRSTSWVGKVIVGRIQTILPGQFAFIDIGTKRNAFMNLRPNHGLKAGQPVLVQVVKDANNQKGAYVTQDISFKGWLAILFEHITGEVGVSRKITDEDESNRLKRLAHELVPRGYGAIIRTNAEGQDQVALAEEITQLHQLHIQIKKRAKYVRPPMVLYPDTSTKVAPLLNDLLSEDISEIHISGDDEEFQLSKNSICEVIPSLAKRIKHYKNDIKLFDKYQLNSQIRAALEKRVNLPCGGNCTFEETEACVVIDVNTSKNVGQGNYQETILQTNLEAAKCIAYQLTLRNLSGIIIVDFIDMTSEEDNNIFMAELARLLSAERIKSEIMGLMSLGMVQLTRRKHRPSLSQILEQTCTHCGGRGTVRRNA